MSRTSESRYAPFYDLFKLIVAIILTIILIFLLLHNPKEESAPLASPPALTETFSTLPTLATATLNPTVQPQPTANLPTETLAPPPTPTPSPVPAPTESFPTSDPNACPSSPSHIQVGDKVKVLSWLNFRRGPGRNWPVISTNSAGTAMTVVGGPVCTTRNTAEGPKAYLWWKVRLENGQEGWSAEAPLIVSDYFLEPIR